MSRAALKKVVRKCRGGLAVSLPLSVGEWLAVAAASALFLPVLFLAWDADAVPDQALMSFWKLKLSGLKLVSFLDPEFTLPDGRILRASLLAEDLKTLYDAAQALPHLERAERSAARMLPFFIILAGWLWSYQKEHTASAGEHIRGRRLVGAGDLASGLDGDGEGLLPMGPVLLPRKYEERHLLVAGERAERCALLTGQLEAIRRAGLPALVHDPTGEFAARFYRPGVDLIANPFDERGLDWNLFDDLESLTELSALAESVVPQNRAAQDVLRGTVAALHLQGKWSHSDLWEALNAPVAGLARLCASVEQGEAGALVLEAPYGRRAELSLALLRSQLSWLEFARGEGGFSVRKWLADPGGSFLFLTSHPDLELTLRPYLSLLAELCGRWLLTQPRRPRVRLFFVLDELAELQLLPGIKRLLNRGGGEGAALILGVRDLASLECRYRSEDVQAILNGCASLMVLRLPDGRTADYFSWRFGDSEYWDTPDPPPAGAKGEPRGSWRVTPRSGRLLLGSQFLDLPERTGYLLMPGREPAPVKLPPGGAPPLPAAPRFLLRKGYALADLAAREVEHCERGLRLGIPAAPERFGAGAGEGAAPGRALDGKLDF